MSEFDPTLTPSAQAPGIGVGDSARFQDQVAADINTIVDRLSTPRDLQASLDAFTRGDTWLRDISYLTESERQTVIVDGRKGALNNESYLLCKNTAELLAYFMSDEQVHKLQPYAGWNFLVNAQGFEKAGYEWAKNLDRCFRAAYGMDISTIIINSVSDPRTQQSLHTLVRQLAADPRFQLAVGYYLAERSLASEHYQEQLYGSELVQAKTRAHAQLQRLATETGLRPDNLVQAQQQIAATKFSAFDHLIGGTTVHEQGSLGDYMPGTFRVEVKF